MAYEIERKFLIQDQSWRNAASGATVIRQAYLASNGLISLRIRIRDDIRATLTIKSAAAGIRRLEFEYEIPIADGVALMDLREGGLIEKLRHKLPQDGLTWEIDVFQGENAGLVIAEIELPHEDKVFERPQWLGREITADKRYSNASLSMTPYRTWTDEAR